MTISTGAAEAIVMGWDIINASNANTVNLKRIEPMIGLIICTSIKIQRAGERRQRLTSDYF